jgi:hypothetical protein
MNQGARRLLNGATATGAGTPIPVGGARTYGIQVRHTGGPASAVIVLEGTINGEDYFTLGTWDSSTNASGDIVWIVDKPVAMIRANLGTLTGGTDPTVTADVIICS